MLGMQVVLDLNAFISIEGLADRKYRTPWPFETLSNPLEWAIPTVDGPVV